MHLRIVAGERISQDAEDMPPNRCGIRRAGYGKAKAVLQAGDLLEQLVIHHYVGARR